MYDLEIIVPAELDSKEIALRLKDFKKWGLVNTNGVDIKLYFLASHDNDPDDLANLCTGWPDNFSVEGIITPYKHVAQRIMHYYDKIVQPDTARWYLRIDEDTRTDIESLMQKMNEWFDHTRDYHVVAEISKEVQETEYKILTSIGYNWFDEIEGYDISTAPIHEIELSITSNEAVKKILANPDCRKLFEIRKEYADGYGDHTFCFAARIAKIYPTSVRFLTRHPRAIEFSIYGGHYCHIHDISRDRHGQYVRWLDLTDGFSNPEIAQEITLNNYFFDWNNEKKWIGFEPNGKIYLKNFKCIPEWSHKIPTFGIWGFTKDGNLSVFITNEFYHNSPPFIFKKTDQDFVCEEKNAKITFSNIEPKITIKKESKIVDKIRML